MSDINGVLLVNKPDGLTSRDVVNRVSKILGTKKIGHTGTLDPMARGVLVLTIGKCTKLSDMLTSKYKEYIAEFKLGYETDTLDVTGTVVKKSNVLPSKSSLEEVIYSFKGEYNQEVPEYSAVKINGKKLYEYARSGIEVVLPKRLVDIKELEILEINEDSVKIKTLVSKGTYIRSLIRDIGEKLGCFATMSSLVRTKQGKFMIEDCYSLDDIENGKYQVLRVDEVLDDVKRIDVDEQLYKKVINGVKMPLKLEEEYVKFFKDDVLVAIYKRENEVYKMYIKMV